MSELLLHFVNPPFLGNTSAFSKRPTKGVWGEKKKDDSVKMSIKQCLMAFLVKPGLSSHSSLSTSEQPQNLGSKIEQPL